MFLQVLEFVSFLLEGARHGETNIYHMLVHVLLKILSLVFSDYKFSSH